MCKGNRKEKEKGKEKGKKIQFRTNKVGWSEMINLK